MDGLNLYAEQRGRSCCSECGATLTATPVCPKCGEANPKWPSIQSYLRGRRIGRERQHEFTAKGKVYD